MYWVLYIVIGLSGICVIAYRTFPIWCQIELLDLEKIPEDRYHLWLVNNELKGMLRDLQEKNDILEEQNESLRDRIKSLTDNISEIKYHSYTAGYQKGLYHQEPKDGKFLDSYENPN